ncbi:MAG TPA: amino-acid N-acetyltransferase [Rhodocyclaceae bacterium]|mgnify:FL=1|jgi:amino-acid N-acetyltransferase|nr:amino-acid N-acetyltransferase [Rhodocyclaceae bacterium]HMW76312.1 amino-acid N-acetyltransferase [Rhodocyclaceae bacterium]HNE42406.1 amino-acid N-acetyltransferase [Rhodocyclaceae bacterium]HNL20447.1 amino-acid N-acetyltransferase [Rhodocyclaceae bacterium]HNM21460.1 amino-acid N-acetyltransferase [Rhodocyclaceae bacterium]
MSDDLYDENFVAWFRAVTPYVNAFRGKTFVIAFGGKAIEEGYTKTLAYDVNLLAALGIRLILVHGARPQIEEELQEKGLPSNYHRGYRITDAATLDCVLDAVGSVYLEVEALLSQGLPNTPMANAQIRVIGGNFITAQPIGVLDGIDLQYAGKVRKVDADGLRAQLGIGNIVLLSCQGASPTGEIFNLQMEEVAEAVATALKADKLVFLSDTRGITDSQGEFKDALTADAAAEFLKDETLSTDLKRYLPCAVRASRQGVGRVHLIGYERDGALLQEIFTHDGVGTVVTREPLENIREARPDDIGNLIALIEPMEEEGILVHRPRELLEREIDRFSVMEHDGIIVGCAALYCHGDDVGELACLAVHPDHREWGYGELLMQRVEMRARKAGIHRLFVLTTRTEHWFVERGFRIVKVDELPEQKRGMYNYQRRSKVLCKPL